MKPLLKWNAGRTHGSARAVIAVACLIGGTPCQRIGCAEPEVQPSARDVLRVAVAQPLTVPGDVERNLSRMEPIVAAAASAGAKIVVFSECSLTGYDLQGISPRAAITPEAAPLDDVSRMAQKYHLAIVVGFYERNANRLYNTALVALDDGQRVIQRKHLLSDVEATTYRVTPDQEVRRLFDVAGFRCAILICADAGIAGIYEDLAARRCEVVITMSAGAGSLQSGIHQAELNNPERRRQYLEKGFVYIAPEAVECSLKLKLAQVACNQQGWDDDAGYFQPGGGWVIDRTGGVAAVVAAHPVFEHLRANWAIGDIER